MSKIKILRSFLPTSTFFHVKSLSYTSRYYVRHVSKSQINQFFANADKNEVKKRKSFLESQTPDNLTTQVLKVYEQQIKQIRQQQSACQIEISNKYSNLIKNARLSQQIKSKSQTQYNQENEDDYQTQEQRLKVQKMNEIIKIQQIQKKRIDKLTQEYRLKFSQAKKQYETQYVKNYMLENIGQLKVDNQLNSDKIAENLSKIVQSQSSFIPNQLVLKKLAFKTSDGKIKQVLLAGIQQNDETHCVYLKKLIQKFKIKDVLTVMPPDMPYFIKTEKSFLQQWTQFLKKPSSAFKFYLNPNPRTIDDIKLSKNFIAPALNGMTKSKSFYQTTYSLMQLNEVNFKFEHQPLYSGLVSNTVQNAYFCDYPFLKQREMIALNVKLSDLRLLIKQFAFYKQQNKQNFSAQLLLPKNVIEKKFRHIIKLAKTISLTNQRPPVLICDASIAQILAQQWKTSPNQFLQYDYSQNTYLLDLQMSSRVQTQVLFIEYIEKLVILDIILKPLIQNYFVKYQSFPYSCRNTVGGKQNLSKVFLVWRHFHELYTTAVKGDVSHPLNKKQIML